MPEDSFDTPRETIRRSPENVPLRPHLADSLLERGRAEGDKRREQRPPQQAAQQFREARRIAPDLERAQAGIVEAMKARHFVYRICLGSIDGMSRLSPRARWGIVIGGYVGFQMLNRLSAAHPVWDVWLLPLMIAYIGFALMTWLAGPLFNLLLRLSPFGRSALSADQTRAANLLGVMLLAACGLLAGAFVVGNSLLLIAAFYTGLLMIPATSICSCSQGWPRWMMAGCTALLAATGIMSLTQVHLVEGAMLSTELGRMANTLFLIGVVGSPFLASYLSDVRVRA